MSARIVIATWGSYGDIFPSLGLALALKARGHEPVLATSGYYCSMVEGQGIGFRPVRPDVDPTQSGVVRRIMNRYRGTEFILRDLLLPVIRDSYADLREAARGADLLVTHPVTFAAPLLAEKERIPWVSTVLAPISFFSAHDPPVFPPAPKLVHLSRFGTWAGRALVGSARAATGRWMKPVRDLRAELGLPPGSSPLFEGQFSPHGTLALFSRVLAEPQPDWPANVRVTGFVFYNGPSRIPPELEEFLAAGPPPVVFTLGSSAVGTAGTFYHESARAIADLGLRAVLLVGPDPKNRPPGPLPDTILAVEYAPHQELFPRAAAVVHQGGIGTTGQALRSGHPTLVVPYSHDQPDNAFRVTNLGVARTLYPRRYRARRLASELRRLLDEPHYSQRAAEIGQAVRAENGTEAACDAIEAVLTAH